MLHQLIENFSNYSISSLGKNIYQISPGLSFLLLAKIANFKKITICTSGPGLPAIIEFDDNDINYHSLILAYFAILSKLHEKTFNLAFDILQKKGIFDNIQ